MDTFFESIAKQRGQTVELAGEPHRIVQIDLVRQEKDGNEWQEIRIICRPVKKAEAVTDYTP